MGAADLSRAACTLVGVPTTCFSSGFAPGAGFHRCTEHADPVLVGFMPRSRAPISVGFPVGSRVPVLMGFTATSREPVPRGVHVWSRDRQVCVLLQPAGNALWNPTMSGLGEAGRSFGPWVWLRGGGVWSKGCGRGEAGWAPLGRGEGSGQRGEGGSLRAVGPSTVGSQAAPSAGWHRPTRVLNRETDARLPRACVVRGLARGPPGGRPPHASESPPRGRPALVRHLLGQ